MKQVTQVVLASGSPRRAELLIQLGVDFTVCVTDVDESRLEGELPRAYVRRLAAEKALAGLNLSSGKLPVLGADTVVLLDELILGKPDSSQEAAQMLHMMSGRDHFVLSAIALARAGAETEVVLNTTRVTFAEMPADFIEFYSSGTEPLDKAGAYAIQGQTGQFVSHIDGSYSSIMGLPLYETGVLLRSAGVLLQHAI